MRVTHDPYLPITRAPDSTTYSVVGEHISQSTNDSRLDCVRVLNGPEVDPWVRPKVVPWVGPDLANDHLPSMYEEKM